MKIWMQISEILRRPVTSGEYKEGKEPFLKKYQSFQALLAQNNTVLELNPDCLIDNLGLTARYFFLDILLFIYFEKKLCTHGYEGVVRLR